MTTEHLITSAMTRIRAILAGVGPGLEDFAEIESVLQSLAAEVDFSTYRRAVPGEELAYALDVPGNGDVALYLVSDGVGAVTPPHTHSTWAVIVGLEGVEMNQIYKVSDAGSKEIQLHSVSNVGKGTAITMAADDIHGTVSTGPEATFHLHLYGCDLASLKPFSERTYSAVPVTAD